MQNNVIGQFHLKIQKRKMTFVLPYVHATKSLNDIAIATPTSYSLWFLGPEAGKWQTTLLDPDGYTARSYTPW